MNKKIVGAKFSPDKKQHIITYYVAKEALEKTIEEIQIVKTIMINIRKRGMYWNISSVPCLPLGFFLIGANK